MCIPYKGLTLHYVQTKEKSKAGQVRAESQAEYQMDEALKSLAKDANKKVKDNRVSDEPNREK